ncbi:outer membrane beta-barrel protein [Roseateles sp. BYS87W]|uniref:Outer membrane beta-barrel protein n=1 Tax=Pelomonas baiyunensis TaxID=3299026 RepID=A0ABW7H3Y0_9BURK
MKKKAIVLGALVAATAAQASEPATSPFYVTAAAGTTRLNADCAGTTSCDNTGAGGKLVFGYNLGNGFSLEGSYINFGKAHASTPPIAGTPAGTITLKPSALVVGGAYALPLGGDWGMAARLGVAQVKTRTNFSYGVQNGDAAESETRLVAGVSVSYALNGNVKLEFGVDTSKAQMHGLKGNVRLVSLGASFAF